MAKQGKVIPKVTCLQCGETLISKSRHDFQQCKCKNQTFVDGGGVDGVVRYGGMDLAKVQVYSKDGCVSPELRKRMPMWTILKENKLKYNSIGSIPRCHNCQQALKVEDFRGAGQTATLYGELHWLSRWECPTCGPFIIATPYPRV